LLTLLTYEHQLLFSLPTLFTNKFPLLCRRSSLIPQRFYKKKHTYKSKYPTDKASISIKHLFIDREITMKKCLFMRK